MELIKEKWNEQDIPEFQKTLTTYENPSKREWSKSILNTELAVLSIKTDDMKYLTSQIYKGNYLSFKEGLDLCQALLNSFNKRYFKIEFQSVEK